MLNVASIDNALKGLAISKRYHFNAHQVAFLSGNSNVDEVYDYLVSREPYILYKEYEVQCPNNFHANGPYSSIEKIPKHWMECRICGEEFIPDINLIQIVFYFTESYLKQVQLELDAEKR